MITILDMITQFECRDDRENEVAWFRTSTPWVAPQAYLNVVYKPSLPLLRKTISDRLRLPRIVIEFFISQNGAMLLSGSLKLYGLVAQGTLLNRLDAFSLPPFDLEQENRGWNVDPERLLVVGSYGADGSRVCVDRISSRIHVFRKREIRPAASWESFDVWLESEVPRLCRLFDGEGKMLASRKSEILPYREM